MKVFKSSIVVFIVAFFAVILAIGSHGNSELMVSVFFVSTIIGIAGGLALYIIWT